MPIPAEPTGRLPYDTPSPPGELLAAARIRLAPGTGAWRSAGAASWVAMWTLGGRGDVEHGSTRIAAEPGTLVLLGSAVPHEYVVDADHDHWEMWWCHFQPRAGWLDWLAPFACAPRAYLVGPVPAAATPAVTDVWQRLHVYLRWSGTGALPAPERPVRAIGHTAASQHAGGHELGLSVLEEILLVTILAARGSWSDETVVDPRVRRVLDVVDADPGAPHSVASLAREVALSPSRLAHLFSEQLGRTPMAVVRARRIRYAARLLDATELTVAQVAAAAGFASPYHFSRTFSAEVGVPPTGYRAGNVSV